MTHALFVASAYGISGLALGGLLAWMVFDHRIQRRELTRLEESGVRRRSQQAAENAR